MAEQMQFAEDRRRLILEEVRLNGSVSIVDLAQRLEVSAVTVRRDLTSMAHEGLLTRVHGGAVVRRTVQRPAQATLAPMPDQHCVGIVTPSTDYFWPTVVSGAQAAVRGYRGQLILRSSSYSLEDDRVQMQRMLDTGRVEGLLVSPVPNMGRSNEVLSWLHELGLPVVLMERKVPPTVFAPHLESVTSDQFCSTQLAMHHLVSLGHRRVGLLTSVGTPHRVAAREAWMSGARMFGLETRGVICEDTPGFSTVNRDPLLDSIIERLMSTGTTGVIIHSDKEAIALLQRCGDIGVRVPGDLSLISHDDEIASLPEPALTAIRPPKYHIGFEAASAVFRRLSDPTIPRRRITLASDLVIRGTTGAPLPR
ncbi:MAG: substrate-binding domain-containing protein [Propionibacteriaceae bacterium]|jgi:DNA-binding LacI/PurR family transcriptional regulator|nr:substrate-binding domain-containing protein [Propionibacteriaceae bacterium]